MKRRLILIAAILLIVLAACQSQTEPGLVLPTPITAATETTAKNTPESTLDDLPAPPTIPAPTVIVTVAPTTQASPVPTIQPTSLPVEAMPVDSGYQVAFVELGDTLNVRSGPGVDYPVVAELQPDATDLAVDDSGQSLVAGSLWVWVEGDDAAGYVNSRFLTESVSGAEFCPDPTVAAILRDLQTAVENRDGRLLAGLVHPDRGLRLRHSWWNNEVLVQGNEVAGLFTDDTVYDWGTADGSGLPITGTVADTLLPLLERDLLDATESACNEVRHGPTAGMTIVPEAYEAVPFVSLYRAPGPQDLEFDWGSWAVGIERWEGQYYLSYLVHYAYEI
ncbi:MAG: hypothetical protein R3C44_15775 [Chloroflexota bacterium]